MARITGSLELNIDNGEKYVFSKSERGIYVAIKEGGRDREILFIPSFAVWDFVKTLNKLDDF